LHWSWFAYFLVPATALLVFFSIVADALTHSDALIAMKTEEWERDEQARRVAAAAAAAAVAAAAQSANDDDDDVVTIMPE
jgi:hypothetical protein